MFNFILGLVIGACAVSLIFVIAILIGEARRKPKKCKKCGKLKTKCECPPTARQLMKEALKLEKELQVAELQKQIDNIKK
jgi:hypothetical protein